MTDKELIKQAYDALDKIADMFEAVNGRCVIGGDDVYYSAVKVMVKLNERLKHEQGAVAWWRCNAQGEPVLVGGSVKPYEDAVPLFTSEPQKPCQPIDHWRSLQFHGGRPISQSKQKPWVGLTDEEISQLIGNQIGFNSWCGWEHEYTRAVEAKIKEKNR